MMISAAPPVGSWRGPASNGWLHGCVPKRLALCCASIPPGSLVTAATVHAYRSAEKNGEWLPMTKAAMIVVER
jgi:hypothetical protein